MLQFYLIDIFLYHYWYKKTGRPLERFFNINYGVISKLKSFKNYFTSINYTLLLKEIIWGDQSHMITKITHVKSLFSMLTVPGEGSCEIWINNTIQMPYYCSRMNIQDHTKKITLPSLEYLITQPIWWIII